MWLREDNISSENEIVLPYESELALWEHPPWTESFSRLRWCCPGLFPAQLNLKREKPDLSNNTHSSSKKKKNALASCLHQVSESDLLPPAQSKTFSDPNQHVYNLHNGYPYFAIYENQAKLTKCDHHELKMQPQTQMYQRRYWRQDVFVDSICKQPPTFTNGFDFVELSPLSSGDFRFGPMTAGPPEILPSCEAVADVVATASPLPRPEKQQQKGTLRNSNKPPVVQRGVSSQDAYSLKPPIHQRPRSLSLSIAQMPPSPVDKALSPNDSLSRPRLGSEASKRSVGTSSTRHRRQVHDEFDFFGTTILRQIGENLDDNQLSTAPPAYIECPTYQFEVDSAWADGKNQDDLSVDDEIQMLISRLPPQSLENVSPLQSLDEDDAGDITYRNNNFAALSAATFSVVQGGAGMPVCLADALPCPSAKEITPTLPRRNGLNPTDHFRLNVERPAFLPRCKARNKPIEKAKNRVIISGWAAISLSDQLWTRLALTESPLQLKRSDISYFQLIEDADPTKQPVLRVTLDSGDHDIMLKDRYEHQFHSLEVCARAGRCVCLLEGSNVLLVILPVSLPRYFFREGRIVEESLFSEWQTALFAPFTRMKPPRSCRETKGVCCKCCLTQYAPDDQYDAAAYVLFALDSVLKPKKVSLQSGSL